MNEEKKIDKAETANENMACNLVLCEVPCPACNGDGYTAEHACDGTEGMCAITCPQQVQCSYCCATGKIQVPKK